MLIAISLLVVYCFVVVVNNDILRSLASCNEFVSCIADLRNLILTVFFRLESHRCSILFV